LSTENFKGYPARLIPVGSDSSKERRVLSVFLSVLAQCPSFSDRLLRSIGKRVGKRTRISVWTEVSFPGVEDLKDRPDGLIRLTTGHSDWTALIEAKVGNAEIQEDQLIRYAELAKRHGIDTVITISNQFVARPDHHPVTLTRALASKVSLFHWSWRSIQTEAALLGIADQELTDGDSFLIQEFLHFLRHDSVGVSGFSRMNREWRDVVQQAARDVPFSKSAPEIEATIAAWHQEQRDLSLQLSEHVGRPVSLKLERKHRQEPATRIREDKDFFSKERSLTCILQVPDAAGDLEITADLSRRTLSFSVGLKAPSDRKSTSARVNWLLRQLSKSEPENIRVKAIWHGRATATERSLVELREDPGSLQTDNPTLAPLWFHVKLFIELGQKFAGPEKFIEELERHLIIFYDEVVKYLKAYQPAAPQPVKRQASSDEDEEAEIDLDSPPAPEESQVNPG